MNNNESNNFFDLKRIERVNNTIPTATLITQEDEKCIPVNHNQFLQNSQKMQFEHSILP